MPTKNSCEATDLGPPLLPAMSSCPAPLSLTCAVNMELSNATMESTCACDNRALACACPSVALWTWLASEASRPSHMMVVRNLRFVAGSGRRNSDSSAALANR